MSFSSHEPVIRIRGCHGTLNLAVLRDAVAQGRIEWRKHVLQKLAERDLRQEAVHEVLFKGEGIRDYAEDRHFSSALFLGYVEGKLLHVVAACDEIDRRVYVITAYEPSLDIFESDYRTRKQS